MTGKPHWSISTTAKGRQPSTLLKQIGGCIAAQIAACQATQWATSTVPAGIKSGVTNDSLYDDRQHIV
jgi:hypothetical protein